jgi:hypothetical protein
VLTDEAFLSPLAVLDAVELPESLVAEPLFAGSEPAGALSDDDPLDPLDPFTEASLAAGTLFAPFRLSVR